MGEEKPPTDATDLSDHIYLDVVHIASRPASKKSLCSTTKETSAEEEPVAERAAEKKQPKKSSSASGVLIVAIVILSAISCALAALYVIERRHTSMLLDEKKQFTSSPTPSTECPTTVSATTVPKKKKSDCASLRFELERGKNVYQMLCSSLPASSVETGQNVPKQCAMESLQFHSLTDTVTSRGGQKMRSATVCFWCRSSPGVRYYVAYLEPNNGRGFNIVEEKSFTSRTYLSWNAFCWTWSTGEERYRFYKNGKLLRGREINRERLMTGGGAWVIGLQSDKPEGASRSTGTELGEITEVNVWDRVMRKNYLMAIMNSCVGSRYTGSVKSWQDFKSGGVKGNVKLVTSTCCNK